MQGKARCKAALQQSLGLAVDAGAPLLAVVSRLTEQKGLDLLLQALREHAGQGGLTLMVCHEPALAASHCRRILFFDNGRLVVYAGLQEAWRELARLGREEYLPPGYLPAVKENGDRNDVS